MPVNSSVLESYIYMWILCVSVCIGFHLPTKGIYVNTTCRKVNSVDKRFGKMRREECQTRLGWVIYFHLDRHWRTELLYGKKILIGTATTEQRYGSDMTTMTSSIVISGDLTLSHDSTSRDRIKCWDQQEFKLKQKEFIR